MSDSIITAVSHCYRATEEKHRGYFVLHFCKGNVEGNYFHVQAARILRAKLKVCSSCQRYLLHYSGFQHFAEPSCLLFAVTNSIRNIIKLHKKSMNLLCTQFLNLVLKIGVGKIQHCFVLRLIFLVFSNQTPTVTFPFCFSLVLLHQFFIQ